MERTRSDALFAESQTYIPGGVNSPVRAYKSVGLSPFFVSRAKGSRIYDVDGNDYIDYVGSWGPMILGHAPEAVLSAVREALDRGTSYGAPTEHELELAKQVVAAVPGIEEVRMVSSGTEATMSAMRLARGFTGRPKFIKFEGCYHGHADPFLVKAGSGVTTLGLPDSPGVTEGATSDTINLAYNDLDAVSESLQSVGEQVAAIIVEPVAGNMGVAPPRAGFLPGLRRLCDEYGVLLIFDEVITGFRVAYGGAQELYDVVPDLTCLGKIIGGGFPVGAFGGRREIMENLAPAGSVYQAGTLSGNPIAMIAGLATLRALEDRGVYADLERKAARLAEGLNDSARELGVEACFTRVGSMLSMFFTGEDVVDFGSAKTSDTAFFSRYFAAMLEHGISLAPSQFEATFVSAAHSEDDIEATIAAARASLVAAMAGQETAASSPTSK